MATAIARVDKGKIRTLETQRGQAEKHPEHEANQARRRQSGPVRHSVALHQDGGGVSAKGEETAVAERDLSAVAGQDVEAEHGNGVDHHHRQLEDVILAKAERQHGGQRDQRRDTEPSPGIDAQAGISVGSELVS